MTSYTIEYASAPARYTIEFAKGTGPQGPSGGGEGGGSFTVREVDNSPSSVCTTLVLPNGTLNVVDGVATYTPSAVAGTILIGEAGEAAAVCTELRFQPGQVSVIDGVATVDIPDGADGADGAPGAPGAPGANGLNADMTRTSNSSVSITIYELKTFTFAASSNLGWGIGTYLRATSLSDGQWMEGQVSSLSSTSVTFWSLATSNPGSGTKTSWSLVVAGKPGDDGAQGDDGINGTNGAAATIAVGTVTTGAPGSSVAIVNGGSSSAAVFNFTIPRGDTGATGAAGAAGQGVPTGGSTNAILAKTSGVDYATSWTNTPILDGLTLPFRTITYAATIAVDLSLGSKKKITLTGSPTISAPTGTPIDGAQIIFRIIQGGAGSHAITWDPVYKFRGPLAGIVWSTAVGAKDHVTFVYDADATPSPEWDCLSFAKGS